ncbi:MAG: hypothetical protein CL846_09735 [Crocinitomicaceae bacterium]|nr:hypothetical protein [Crocinitomicaceae bacterium]|tara:strand:- start:1571 stop:2296 length:726 start_codon:yes stop_codon:yes gene_type:complete
MDNLNTLSKNWFSDGWIDYEYKKYELLSYLQKIDKLFNQTKLYPYFSYLINHYQNISKYINLQKDFKKSFNKNIQSIDLKNLEINFESKFKDHEVIEEMINIVNFAKKEIKNSIDQGEELYDFIFSKMRIESVGLVPFYNKEGYLIITKNGDKNASIFRYKCSLIHYESDNYYGLKTQKINNDLYNYNSTPSSIKINLINQFKDLPNPATYSLHCDLNFSFKHSIIPIAKRWLIKHINTTA